MSFSVIWLRSQNKLTRNWCVKAELIRSDIFILMKLFTHSGTILEMHMAGMLV